MKIRQFTLADTHDVIVLWEVCGLTRPWNNPQLDIARKVAQNDEGFIVVDQNGEIIASAMFGYDGHRGSVNYLAVSPEYQGKQLGRKLMDYIEATLTEKGCPKINLMVRAGNEQVLDFYEALGYHEEQAVSLGKRLIED